MLSLFAQFALLTASLAAAQDVIDNLSFGHKQGLSPNSFSIPGWSMLGEGYVPQLMSDKVILTPPYGGGKRGALWSQAKSQSEQWSAAVEFRAGGVDNGKGNLQAWYVKDGERSVTTGSIYTAGRFDGLAVVVDTNAGVQKVRGFLNDGTIEYRSHPNVDSLAFGHCSYNYRNLGRPTRLEIKSTTGGLEIFVDSKPCFSTNKVTLPSDYNYGITAASSDPPDSFEVFKYEVRTASSEPTNVAPPILNQQQPDQGATPIRLRQPMMAIETQYQDLNNRLDQLNKAISNMFTEINRHTKAEEDRYQEILKQLPSGSAMGSLESRLSNLDRLLNDLKNELKGGNHKEQFAKLSAQLQETHQGVTQQLPGTMRDYVQNHTPRIGFIVFSFMAFQSCCLAILLWQKWRKSTMPKKYL